MVMSKIPKLTITEENSKEEATITDDRPAMATETSSPEPEDGLNGVDYHQFPADTIREVWLNVFEKLDTKDKITFSKTCAEWHDWVAPTRTYFTFSELPITKGVGIRELLKCRSICKSWTQDIDRQIQGHPSPLLLKVEMENENDKIIQNELKNVVTRFEFPEQIERFLVQMKSHNGNPFPGRNISLICDIPEPVMPVEGANELEMTRTFWRNTIELLEAFGSHVYIVSFYFYPLRPNIVLDATETLEYLRTSLSHLPNLKRLNFFGLNNLTLLDNARDFYRDNPLSRLPHLKTVSMTWTSNAILSEVLETFVESETLTRFHLLPGRSIFELPDALFNFPNLEVLDATLRIEYLERFGNLLGRAPPLKVIYLRFYRNPQDFQRVFRSLEVFSQSLTVVTLNATYSEDSLRGAVATGFLINLPKLERLILNGFGGPLDPFCQLESLKYLHFKYPELQEWEGSTVDFYGFENRMEESNVWEKIPSLQVFQFNDKTCTRPIIQLSSD